MSEEQVTFKVTDRRLFNTDGTLREENRRAAEANAEPTLVVATATIAPQPAAPTSQAAPVPQAATPEPTPAPLPEEDPADAQNPASFINFIMSLASNAASALGMMEHPVTGQVGVDLPMAQYWIEILTMLRRKTSGNLNGQEIQMFEGLLADLRMQYVALSQPRPKPKSAGLSARDIMGRR